MKAVSHMDLLTPAGGPSSPLRSEACSTLNSAYSASKTGSARWIVSISLALESMMPSTVAITPSTSFPARSSGGFLRSEEHTSELQSLMRISYAVFCLTKKQSTHTQIQLNYTIY